MSKRQFHNPLAKLNRFEWTLWISSMAVVTLAFLLGGRMGVISYIASMLGVTALIFIARGDVTGQFLVVIFALLYGFVSWQERYYGEMLTYVCMSAPAGVLAIISWIRHPFKEDGSEVEVNRIGGAEWGLLCLLTAAVTTVFYFLLGAFGTAQLAVSTISVATSFFAAYLTFRRSPYYALAYTANDIVLIVLWMIAAWQDPSYFSMVACFAMFLFNDLYGFINWLRMERRQRAADPA